MNLWAKSLRQLPFVAAVALFFFSCEDENAILGFKNPIPKFNVSYVEIPLTSNFQRIDSIITDNKGGTGNLLIGKYQDNAFGTITATPVLQIAPTALTQIADDAIYDSVTLSIRYNFYGYGFAGRRTERFEIHEILDTLDRLPASNTKAQRYEYDRPVSYNPALLGTSFVSIDTDSLRKQYATASTSQDTLTARARLDDDFGFRIFSLSQAYLFNSQAQLRDFNDKIPGLALIPTESEAILGFRIFNNLTSVTIHYHTVASGAVKDTLSRTYGFSGSSYTNINADRAGTALASAVPYQSISTSPASGVRYIQSGNPVITKLDLSNFYAFADTVGSVLINEASIVIDGVESSLTTPPIDGLALKVMNDNNLFTNIALPATDRIAMTPYAQSEVIVSDGRHYIVRSENPTSNSQVATLDYSEGKYSGYFTLFMQQLIKHRANADRLRHLGLYPFSPSVSASVSRTVFNAENVKLRIYYTKPTLTTSPN